MTTVSDVATLQTSNFTTTTDLVLEGYYGPGTGGGGTLINDPTAGTPDGGLVFHDGASPPNLFRRVDPTGDVREWGARCNAVIETNHGTSLSANTFTSSPAIDPSFIGANIAIVGAGPSGGVLATTITAISGTTVTVAGTISTPFPQYVANGLFIVTAKPGSMRGILSGGSSYQNGDLITVSDGTVYEVYANTGGAITALLVNTQTGLLSSLPALPLSQASTTGSGSGLSITPGYTTTGTYAYGFDDSVAINAALNGLPSVGLDAFIPLGGICGLANTVSLPANGVTLSGKDWMSSGLISLAPMTRTLYRDASAGFGGSVQNLYVDAYNLADSAVEQEGGAAVFWWRVSARNATVQNWWAGSSSTVLTAGTFIFNCETRTRFMPFGLGSQQPQYGFNFDVGFSDSRVLEIVNQGATVSGIRMGGVASHLTEINCFPVANKPFQYGIDVLTKCTITNAQIGSDGIVAAIHVDKPHASIHGTFCESGLLAPDLTTAIGILIEDGANSGQSIVTNTTQDGTFSPDNLIVQLGTGDPGSVVVNNPGASYNAAPYVIGRNYLENGAFQVWQEATSYNLSSASAAGGIFISDRWKVYSNSAVDFTVSRDAGFANSQYALKTQRTGGPTGPHSIWFGQQIESSVATELAGKTVTISYDAFSGPDYSGKPWGADIHIYTGQGIDEAFNFSSLAFPTSPVASASLHTSGSITGMSQRFQSVRYTIPAGTTEIMIVFQVGVTMAIGTDDSFHISNVKLEVGDIGTAFEPQQPAALYGACQRQYYKSFALATAPAQNVGTGTGEFCASASKAGAVSQLVGTVPFGTMMRKAPTVTTFNPAAANAQVRDETAGADCASVVIDNVTQNGCRISCTGASSTAVGNVLGVHLVADARL